MMAVGFIQSSICTVTVVVAVNPRLSVTVAVAVTLLAELITALPPTWLDPDAVSVYVRPLTVTLTDDTVAEFLAAAVTV